ncbi:creatininase family protein [Georgenia alba]|uniref:Creatininase family protein n=1 Tax=Georgenia alba TaxID=2233858 RepID=A0ABW2Q4G1_9MICO
MNDRPTSPPATSYARRTSPERQQASTPRAVLVPAGAVEQHGPHLPLGVDAWLATALCHRVAGVLGDAVTVAEPLSYGCSWHHTTFAGTVSLRTSTFVALLTDVCAALHADGNHVVIVNGHGGNRGVLQVAAADLAAQGVPTWSVSYFELLGDIVARLFDDPRSAGHACAMETSMMLFLWPELVRARLVPEGGTPTSWPDQHLFGGDHVRTVRSFDKINPTGVVGRPDLARADAGEELVNEAVARLVDIVRRVLSQPTAAGSPSEQ